MDSTTKEMVECIEIQKKVIQDLETTVSELNARIDSIEPGDAQNVLIEQANAARQELEEERKGLAALESQLNTMQQANTGAAMSFEQIRSTLGEIGAACEVHEKALASLEAEYDRLGAEMGKAYMSGRDDEYIALKQQQSAIQGEIRVRKSLLNELRDQSNALEEVATKIETERANVEKAANAHTSCAQKSVRSKKKWRICVPMALMKIRRHTKTLSMSWDDCKTFKVIFRRKGQSWRMMKTNLRVCCPACKVLSVDSRRHKVRLPYSVQRMKNYNV